jgi:hypothetical protein
VLLANGGNLFEYWNRPEVMAQFEKNMDEYGKLAQTQMQAMSGIFQDANKSASNAFEYFENSRDLQVSIANQIKDLMQTLLTGGTLMGWVQSQINSKVADVISAATGLPAGFISAVLGGAKPADAAKQYFQGVMLSKMEEVTGIQGLSQILGQMIAKKKADAAAKKAKQAAIAQTVVAVAGVVAAPFTAGASLAVAAGAGAALGAAQVVAQGGPINLQSVAVGAVGGAINGAVSSVSGGFVHVNLSYSTEGGYGAGLSVGTPGGPGVGLTYSEKSGVGVDVRGSIGVGALALGGTIHYDSQNGASASVGVMLQDDFTGAHIGLQTTYSQSDGFGGVSLAGGVGDKHEGADLAINLQSGDVTASYHNENDKVTYGDGGLTVDYGGLHANYNDGKLTGSYGAITYNDGKWGVDVQGGISSALTGYVNQAVKDARDQVQNYVNQNVNDARNQAQNYANDQINAQRDAAGNYINGPLGTANNAINVLRPGAFDTSFGSFANEGQFYTNQYNNYLNDFMSKPGEFNLGFDSHWNFTGSYSAGGLTINSNGTVTGSIGPISIDPHGVLSTSIGGLTVSSNGNVNGTIGTDTPYGAVGVSITNGQLGASLSGDLGNINYANGQIGGNVNAGPFGLGIHDGQLTQFLEY